MRASDSARRRANWRALASAGWITCAFSVDSRAVPCSEVKIGSSRGKADRPLSFEMNARGYG